MLFDGNEMVTLGGDRVREKAARLGMRVCFRDCRATGVGRPLREAAMLAKAYVTKAIEKSYPTGKGRWPLDHFYRQH